MTSPSQTLVEATDKFNKAGECFDVFSKLGDIADTAYDYAYNQYAVLVGKLAPVLSKEELENGISLDLYEWGTNRHDMGPSPKNADVLLTAYTGLTAVLATAKHANETGDTTAELAYLRALAGKVQCLLDLANE